MAMMRPYVTLITIGITLLPLLAAPAVSRAADLPDGAAPGQRERSESLTTTQEDLVLKSSPYESVKGFASYYARRFEGRRTASGQRYNPDKLTAAHESLPLGTVVRVMNPVSKQSVIVTITDRCASKAYHFIDLSRAAAKKIGLWGKGKIRVVITPLAKDRPDKPA
jgi:rare lipoprotein A